MLSSLLGKLAGQMVEPIADLISEVVEDKDKANELAHKIATMSEEHAHTIALAQIEVNKLDAQSDSLWQSGWRPYVGWICGTGLLSQVMIFPVLIGLGIPVPIDTTLLLTTLGGLLGFGGLRTVEKLKR